jgi:hypothetical protein
MTDGEIAVARNVLPARREAVEDESPGYLFSRQHYENALRIEMEMLVGVARELLYRSDGGADPYDTPVIRQRRQEAARAALNVLWAMMSEYNAQEGEPSLTPGLIQFSPPEQRRLLLSFFSLEAHGAQAGVNGRPRLPLYYRGRAQGGICTPPFRGLGLKHAPVWITPPLAA